MTKYEESFGEFLRRRMDELGTNSRQLGLAAGIRLGTISAWVTGKRVPSPEYCLVLAEYLALDTDEVLDRAGYRPRMMTDADPAREEIRKIVEQLPDSELELVREFTRWRLARAGSTPVQRAKRKPHNPESSREAALPQDQ